MSAEDGGNLDDRYREIANYSVGSRWRKKEIVVLTAEKLDVSKRTIRTRVDYLEENGFIETVQVNPKRVFLEFNDEYEDIFEYEPKNQSKVQSLLEEANQLVTTVASETFPSRLKQESSLISNWVHSIDSYIRNNELPHKELMELETRIEDLHTHCRDEFVVIKGERQLEYTFNIFDHLIFLLENHDEINNIEKKPEFVTSIPTTDLTTILSTYIKFLENISLNAKIVGCQQRYNSRISKRMGKLQAIVENGPDSIREQVYYMIHSHGSTQQKIDAFVSRLKYQDNINYDDLLRHVRFLYTKEEQEGLRRKLSETAADLKKQHQYTVINLCNYLEKDQKVIQVDTRIKYYNQTKRKIIAILSHGHKKLEDIEILSAERNDNVLQNIDTLSDDNYVDSVTDRHGYYRLNNEIGKSFGKIRRQTPAAETKKVRETLDRMQEWREKHVYPKGARSYESEEEALERVRGLPGHELYRYVLYYSFVLEGEEELDLFFEILDQDLEVLQDTERYLLEMPNELLIMFSILELLDNQWYRGLENINYHSYVSERLDELKKAHDCAPLYARKFIRRSISVVDFEDAHKLFAQAVADSQESVDDLKQSVDDIYYSNHRMHEVVDLLSDDKPSSAKGKDVRKELLEYSINIPYKTQF